MSAQQVVDQLGENVKNFSVGDHVVYVRPLVPEESVMRARLVMSTFVQT